LFPPFGIERAKALAKGGHPVFKRSKGVHREGGQESGKEEKESLKKKRAPFLLGSGKSSRTYAARPVKRGATLFHKILGWEETLEGRGLQERELGVLVHWGGPTFTL